MTRMRPHWLLCLALLGFAVTLSGCVGSAAATNKTYYILDAQRKGEPAPVHADATLRVRRFNVDEAFATKQLVYRIAEFRYESDYYHEFMVLPGAIITEQTRDWLADSGLFARVSSVGSRLESTYLLEGNVTALYADFRNEAAPTAVVEIRFFLLAGPDTNETVALARTYRAESPLAAQTAAGVVEALSKGLTDILTRLEPDIEKTIAPKK
jgi:cholesterol transport system auxiliary component